jgi:hypothetical protein
MGVLAENPSEALTPKPYLRCYSDLVMSDREIVDIYLFLWSLSGRVIRRTSRSSTTDPIGTSAGPLPRLRGHRGQSQLRQRRRLFVELALDDAPCTEAGAVEGEAHERGTRRVTVD